MSLWLYFHPRIGTSPESSTRESLARSKGGRRRVLLWVSLVLSAAAAGRAWGGVFSPPPPPEVAPVISAEYPNDLNGNCIADELEATTAPTQGLSIAGGEEKLSADADTLSDGMVAVELIFSEPVTQQQIDDFLALGGQITYVFQSISYGWNGRIAGEQVESLPGVMGPALVLVEPIRRVTAYMDLASQTGRVRPAWQGGFAGQGTGFDGDPGTTIAFIDCGVDGQHTDLAGRCVYWRDFTDDEELTPVDFDGHGTAAAGVALGSGQAGGADNSALRFTYSAFWPDWGFLVEPFDLPSGYSTLRSQAFWTGSSAGLLHMRWTKGTLLTGLAPTGNTTGAAGSPPLSLTSYLQGQTLSVYSVMLGALSEYGILDSAVIVNSVDPYPGIGDGFNKFRGVAPACKWAAAKVFRRDGSMEGDLYSAALDDFVSHRVEKKIKVISISHGLMGYDWLPAESVPMRDKVNTIVNNGIVVVAAAGNSATAESELERKMADPARAAMAITVGASNDRNTLTEYSTHGFFGPRKNEDYKPDVIAPGGSAFYSAIMSVDSGSCDGYNMDRQANDYVNLMGTSFSAPFVAGSAALVIEAMERQGTVWDFNSSDLPRYVKMLLCATASETNAKRESNSLNPTPERGAAGPNLFPQCKDPYEGFGMINPDAAVEAVMRTYVAGSDATDALGAGATDKRVWARTVHLITGADIDFSLDVPANADFDLYLYNMIPSPTGTPGELVTSALAGDGADERIHFVPASDATALLVVKRVSGAGMFTLHSMQAGPPTAQDVVVTAGVDSPVTVTLNAVDDGSPVPPGAMTFTIASLPGHGRLETVATGAVISHVPAALPAPTRQVIYRPDAGYVGSDSFSFYADDGGTPPFGGQSNTATVRISVVREITVECQVSAGADDASGLKYSTYQELSGPALVVGGSVAGMRFQNIQIPQNALIKSATLSICSYTYSLEARLDAKLQAEATDSAADFSARRVATLPRTSASQTWNWDGTPWTANTWYDSPDIRQLIQEVVERPGWSPGNALAIIYSSSSYEGDRRFWSYDGAPDKAARLKITYQPR